MPDVFEKNQQFSGFAIPLRHRSGRKCGFALNLVTTQLPSEERGGPDSTVCSVFICLEFCYMRLTPECALPEATRIIGFVLPTKPQIRHKMWDVICFVE